jgi:hypothetical protein
VKKSLLTLAFALLSAQSAQALINGETVSGKVDLVRITFTNGWVCSGAYLDSTTILTAAHCLTSPDKNTKLQIDKIQAEGDSIVDVRQVALIPHPKFSAQTWHSFDVGIIKTTKYAKFDGEFVLETEPQSNIGKIRLFGSGRTTVEGESYGRSTGVNSYLKIGPILFFIGRSNSENPSDGDAVSIAPNDSGGPIVNRQTGKVVGVSTTTSLKWSFQFGLPTVSTATSTSSTENLDFIFRHLNPAGVTKYEVEVRPDLGRKNFSGDTILTVLSETESTLAIPIGTLKIDGIDVDGKPSKAKIETGKLALPARKGISRIAVKYHSDSAAGLVFGEGFVYSGYETCSWMICDMSPGKKALAEIRVVAPANYKTVSSKEILPYSTYLFGFAAGAFHELNLSAGGKNLRFLGMVDDEKSLKARFNDTKRMIDFYEEKSGIPLPHGSYTQVLIPGSEAQEKSSFSVIGKEELDPILKDPHEDWVIAHELAHQWWGNLLTCKTWSDFWMNEGITVFMTAAYKESRWGKQDYEKELVLARKRYQFAIDNHFDVPLTFAGTYPSMRIKRSIVYYKGALFMDALRKKIGEQKFWTGLREYTRTNAGKSVETKMLQLAMERSSGQSLKDLFDQWAYRKDIQ